jgi:hypothetical protein
MPGFPLPGRLGREPDESLLDALLDGRYLPPDAPEELRAAAEMLDGLNGPAEPDELAGEAAARSAFARLTSPAGASPVARSARRKRSRLSGPRSARVAAALVAATIGLGGTAAAYADALPSPIQDFAHRMVGAPPAHGVRHPTPQPAKHKPSNADRAAVQKGHAKSQPAKPTKPGEVKPAKPGKTTSDAQPKPPAKPKDHGKAKDQAMVKHAKAVGVLPEKPHGRWNGRKLSPLLPLPTR